MSKRNTRDHVLLCGVLFLSLSIAPPAMARRPFAQLPGGHLLIEEVMVDFQTEQIVITGENFDFGPGPLIVTLGNDPGDISGLCNRSVGNESTEIVCDFSSSGLPDDGNYLLTISNGIGQSQSDEYDLTISAVEPPGGGICRDDRVVVEENCVVSAGEVNNPPLAPGDVSLEACSAECPEGTLLVGGGCFVASNEFNHLGLIRSIPVVGPETPAGAWECGVINGSTTDTAPAVSMEAKAICLVISPNCPQEP